ncbi:hypothetical protein F5Y09DRAFT_352103 [Xylaria sp. FL1042]|nr:hypothetical protein F5Y09DRAFT_352103 [Xylaria sp. FL1042]
MCKIIYYICSKCFCGYPRFTECCDFMHPPLIYCPMSTQFKFHIVPETECHLHPHHAPLLHLGVNGEDAVLPVSPSGSGPVIEAVTDDPLEGDLSASKNTKTYPTFRIAPSRGPTLFEAPGTENGEQVPDEQERQQNNYYRANSTEMTQPTNRDDWLYGGVVNGSSGFHGSRRSHRHLASQTRGRSQWQTTNAGNWSGREDRASKNNYITRRPGPRDQPHSSSTYGHYTNQGHSDYSNAPFYFQYQPRDNPQYQYYPYQAAPPPPFYAFSASTPPGCTYMPVQGWGQHCSHCQHQNQASSPFSHLYPNEMFQGHTHGYNDIISQWNQFSWNTQETTSALHSRDDYRSEMRRENLDQLQRSNDAAYYNYRHHEHSQSLFSYEEEGGVAVESGTSFLRSAHPEMLNAEEAYPQSSKDHHSRPRSLSESCIQRLPTSQEPSPVIEGELHLSHDNHHGSNNDGEGRETVRSPSLTLVNESSSNPSVQPATPEISYIKYHGTVKVSDQAGEINPIGSEETECDGSIKQESDDENYKLGNLASWTPTSVKTDPENEVKLCDIPSACMGQQVPNQVHYGDNESPFDTEDGHGAFKPPEVPPNSPVFSPFHLEMAHRGRNTFENDSQPSERDGSIDGLHMPKPVRHWAPMQDAFLDDSLPTAITTSAIDSNSNLSTRARETPSLDASKNIPLASRKSRPNNEKTWSAVVSGKYVPSKSSDPFPAQVTAPTCAIHEATPKDELGKIPEQSTVMPHSPTQAPQIPQELPNDPSIILQHVQPILPTTSAYSMPPPNSPTSPALVPAAPENSLDMPNCVWERRFPSFSSSGSDHYVIMTDTATNSESDAAAPIPDVQPAQDANSTSLVTTVQPIESPQTSRVTLIAPAPASPLAATECRTIAAPRSWSQLFQKPGGPKKPQSLKPKSESNMDETNWPHLGSGDPKKGRKRNTSS